MKFMPLAAVFTLLAVSACSVENTHVGTTASSSPVTSQISLQTSSDSSSERSISGSLLVPLTFDAQGILSAADRLNFPYLKNESGSVQELHVLTKDGDHLLTSYNERLPDNSIAETYQMSPHGPFYIAGIGSEGNTVLGDKGDDLTAEYAFFKKKPFSISSFFRIDAERYAYSIGPDDTTEGGSGAGVYVRYVSDRSQKFLDLSQVNLTGGGGPSGLVPLCLSADGKSLYIRHQPWEGFTYGAIWKMNLSDMRTGPVITFNDKIYAYQCHDKSDLIIGVRTENNPDGGMGGSPWPPSSLILFDAMKGTAVTLDTSNDSLINSAVISPDGKRIIYTRLLAAKSVSSDESDPFNSADTKTELIVMNIDGTNKHVFHGFDEVIGMSDNGKILVTVSRNADKTEFFILNTEDSHFASLLAAGGGPKSIPCSYGMGFDCHY